MAKKLDEDLADQLSEQKDEQTAKFLHKLAENGKERGLPESLIAFYEEKAWKSLKSAEERPEKCKKCGIPANFDGNLQKSIDLKCRNCGEERKIEEKRVLKRPKTPKEPKEPPAKIIKPSPRKIAFTPPPAIIPPPLLLSNSKKSAKKSKLKIPVQKEPDFLQKLFGIGANPV